MSPSASIFINFLKRYEQNKGIYAVIEEIQQPVLPHGKKMGFKKKRHTTFFAIICFGFVHHLSMENCEKRSSYLKMNMKVWVQSSVKSVTISIRG